MGEQGGKVGIIQVIIDDKAGIHRDPAAFIVDLDGVAVTARAQLPLIDCDPVSVRQGESRGVPAIPVPTTATRMPIPETDH